MVTRFIISHNGNGKQPSLAAHLGERGRLAFEKYKGDRTTGAWWEKRTASRRLPLSEGDLANLRESGLTDETILANGLYTADGALHIPYRHTDGKTNGFCRTRPHKPRMRDGKPIKYEQPPGSPVRAYFPAASLPKLLDGGSDVFMTEGEKKALTLDQHGFPTIGLGGVYNWKNKGTEELIDDLAEIDWGRVVYVVFDYDEKPITQRNVDLACRRLADALRKAGAKEVYAVKLPPGPDGGKMGVDDFLVSHDKEAFCKLIESAEPVPAAASPVLARPSGRTDAANATRLVAKYGDEFRFVPPWGKFIKWNGQRWELDESLRIELLTKNIASDLWREIAASSGTDSDTIKRMVEFAKVANSANGIRNTVALAKSEPEIQIAPAALDADPLLLNVENGTVDLRTGELRDHQRDDFITKLAPVAFDAEATCPRFRRFLRQIFDNNRELIGYVQRLAGYSLTGMTEEHVLPFLYGTGANGKSTLTEIFLKLLGFDYAMKAAPDLLLAKRGESHPTDRADLFGKRAVFCNETSEGRRMDEALVKDLTGGERVRARRMREDFWEFPPTHTVWLAGNHKPVILGTDYGIWRRIKLIPFTVTIPDAEQDKKLPAKLARELPGILNWAIEGCLEWQRAGLQEPDIVRISTTEYSADMDEVGQFLEEHCEFGPGPTFVAPASELFSLYARDGGTLTQQSFGANLRRRGFESVRLTRGILKAKKAWQGVRLRVGKDRSV